MRIANEIAADAMEHVRGELRPGMTESRGRRAVAGPRPRRGDGSRRQVDLALGFSLVWSGPGIRTFTATGDRPVQENEPTLFEIWVCADGYWCDHTKNRLPGRARAALRRAARAAARGLRTAPSTTSDRAPSSRSSTGSCREGIDDAGYPGQPSHPVAHGVGARAHEPPYAHQAGGGTVEAGMVLAIEPGIYWPEGGGLQRRGQLPRHSRRSREALLLPGRLR